MNSRNSRSMKDIGIKAMIGISAVGVAVALGKFFS
jgi:purine nucleoside phosphorylase